MLSSENALEKYITKELRAIVQPHGKNIQRQPTERRERRKSADISIGIGEIIIELKILRPKHGLLDLYRLFYQAVKYQKMAKQQLIIFVIDQGNILTKEDMKDLRSLGKEEGFVKIIRRRA